MIFREKLQNEYHNADIDEIVRAGCPDDYGYETYSECGNSEYGDGAVRKCEKCWNREMPNTEYKQKVANPPTQEVLDELHKNIKTIPQSEVDAYNQGHADGMAQGMSDAWELALKFSKMDDSEREKIFDCSNDTFFFDNKWITPQEALAKLKAYEEQRKIEVGDIIEIDDGILGVVTFTTNTEQAYGVDSCGLLFVDMPFHSCKKTGKHIDIKSILEQIGE